MKYTPLKVSLIVFIFSTAIIAASCNRKDKDKSNDSDTELASDNAFSESTYSDVVNMADDASEKKTGDNLSNYKTRSSCATITHDTSSIPRIITIDFGPTNCLCNDGRYRRGKILVSYTGRYRDSGSVHNIGFDNYFVNNRNILGSKTVSNMGHNTSGNLYFNIVVNGLVVKPSGDSVIWNSNRTRTWIAGEGTPTRIDDIYEISGSASGTRAGGTYTMNIIQPLVRKVACDWITSGQMEVQPSGKPLRLIDFGSGTCDNTATVTISGVVHSITLP